jgi:hypothetical protein
MMANIIKILKILALNILTLPFADALCSSLMRMSAANKVFTAKL